jgi:hypothetical protein
VARGCCRLPSRHCRGDHTIWWTCRKYLGDGVIAYFGWPEAHDNDGERAARAGLAILEAISKLNNKSVRPKLTARVGIDSGPVVVGSGAGKETDVFGDTPNIAARLQATATPGTVLITAATHRLISGLFVIEALGPRVLKGIPAPPEVFQLIRPTGVRGKLRAARGLTPFVGREEELRLLLNRWERTREGEGQMALIIGEPGIGKSRLVAEFHDRIREAPHIWMESAGEQFFENTPFHAAIEMLSQWLELKGGANPDDRFEPLERALSAAGLDPQDVAPLVAELLQLQIGGRYPPLMLTPEAKRQRLLAALTRWVFSAARLQPVVMVVEDLHWLDPSTLEVQQLLVEQGVVTPLWERISDHLPIPPLSLWLPFGSAGNLFYVAQALGLAEIHFRHWRHDPRSVLEILRSRRIEYRLKLAQALTLCFTFSLARLVTWRWAVKRRRLAASVEMSVNHVCERPRVFGVQALAIAPDIRTVLRRDLLSPCRLLLWLGYRDGWRSTISLLSVHVRYFQLSAQAPWLTTFTARPFRHWVGRVTPLTRTSLPRPPNRV